MATITCVHCGATREIVRMEQAHCYRDECIQGWAELEVRRRTVRSGDCLNWTGTLRSGTPTLKVTVGSGVAKELRVRAIALRSVGLAVGTGLHVNPSCGNALCVEPAHLSLAPRRDEKVYELRGRLDAAPLLRLIDIALLTREPPAARLLRIAAEARRFGWITVGKGDEICCDWLGVHPVEIWGEEFFTA